MSNSGLKGRIAAVCATLVVVASPAGALAASSGDQQYCDPFGGCPDSGSRSSQALNYRLHDLSTLAAAARGSGSGDAASAAAEAAARNRLLQDRDLLGAAGRVLDAAGLSGLKSALPAKAR